MLAQTDQRLAGDRVIPDRLVSLSNPDARIWVGLGSFAYNLQRMTVIT